MLLSTASFAQSEKHEVTVSNSLSLPLDMLYFKCKITDTGAEIKWRTAIESNVKEFIIEYSNDAINWGKFMTVPALNENRVSDYKLYTLSNYQYYRISSVDFNGRPILHNIINCDNKDLTNSESIVNVYNVNGSLMLENTVKSSIYSLLSPGVYIFKDVETKVTKIIQIQ